MASRLAIDVVKICLSCEGVTDTQAHRCGYCDAPLLSTDAVHYPARRGELDASNPLLGTIIDGKYRLQSVLGRGGLGTVFRAQHVGSLVTVALKLLHPRFSEKPEYRRALLPEARRAATVVHERCARLLDVGEGDEGITYLAMELVEGQTLDEVLQQGPLAPSHTVDLLLQVTAALSAVHEVGLVHCDLSPRNVMVSSRSGRLEVKVLDFGIARSMTMAGREHAPGELWGFANPAFSAPELLLGQEVDARADLYSLGTLGWLMLTGTMPVDDSDPERAAAAVREGRLSEWPVGTRVPKRLGALMQRCLRFEAAERPSSAGDVQRSLQAVRTGRGPWLVRLAAVAGMLALILAMAGSDAAVPSLVGLPSSPLQLTDRELTTESRVQHLRPQELANIVCYYSGFRRQRLRAELARSGTVLASFPLQPPAGNRTGTLLLADAQEDWSNVVKSLLRASQKGPVDLVFVVPGTALVRSARVRVDEQAPTVEAQLLPDGGGLRRESRIDVKLGDDIGVTRAELLVRFDSGDTHLLALPTVSGPFAVGAALADEVAPSAELSAGTLQVTVTDAAGNEQVSSPLPFASADVAVPQVVQLTGPSGKRAIERHGDRLRLRVELSHLEQGCSLHCWTDDPKKKVTVPLQVDAGSASNWRVLEVPVGSLHGTAGDVALNLEVEDAAGNRSKREFATTIVNRSPEIAIRAEVRTDVGPAVWTGGELVLGPEGGLVSVSAPNYRVVGTRLRRAGQTIEPAPIRIENQGARSELEIGGLRAGVYDLSIELAEATDEPIEPLTHRIALRVLPEKIEIGVPSCAGRYLSQYLGAVLRKGERGYREGAGWSIDAELRPYVGGELWLRGFSSPIARAPGHLLPELDFDQGRNELALQLTDVLGRPVTLVDEAGAPLPSRSGRQVIADFWWSDADPVLLRDLSLEHGQRARVSLRMPLPFLAADVVTLRLSNGVVVTGEVTPGPRQSDVTFDLKFEDWSAAARLAGESREAYAQGLQGSIEVHLTTPAETERRFVFAVQTERSTLQPMRLGKVVEVPDGLSDLLLLPVLAPEGDFVEPSSQRFPPRHTFRAHDRVDVRGMTDILLQSRELVWREARALRNFATKIVDDEARTACVHYLDPLGKDRLRPHNLLPLVAAGAAPADEAVLAGVDFFQAWSLTRLLGLAVGDDANLFRLPFGYELERAAYGEDSGSAAHAAKARGGAVSAAAFGEDTAPVVPWTAAQTRSFGDVIPTRFGEGNEFVGLDFGVQEWVLDLPRRAKADLVVVEWVSDHQKHLERVLGLASGRKDMLPDRVGHLRLLGVVRGLAFGDRTGLIDRQGHPLTVARHRDLPATVPGVLRTVQLARDGSDLLGGGRDPRLRRVGFRVAGDAKVLARRWGYR